MNQTNHSNDGDSRRNDDQDRVERIDADPPYGPASADDVERFRKLLAELIARRILAERRRPPAPGDKGQP
ncbi:MAG: hypothetical protein ACKOYJ_09745 [Planctomycetia bacterium]